LLRHRRPARLGGDEFAALITVADPPEAAELSGALTGAIAAPIKVEDITITIGASVGFATSPQDGRTAAALLRHADAAMYRLKHRGDSGRRANRSQD